MEKITRIDRKLVHHGAIVDFYEDTMQFPNGNQAKWDFISHKGAAAILAVDNEGKLLMVRQYRGAIDSEYLEIPAGGRDPGEDFKTCAMRELEEETGYRPLWAKPLLDIYTTAAFCNERIGIYYTEEIEPSTQRLDENEYVSIERYALDEVVTMILNGEIMDSKTVSSVLTYKALKDREK